MLSEYRQDMIAIIDLDDLAESVREFGGIKLDMKALVDHLLAPKPVKRVLRRIHVIVGAEQLAPDVEAFLRQIRSDIHFSNDGRPDCLVFVHAHRAAEITDVVALVVGKAGYLPLVRHLKTMGCRAEIHVGPSVHGGLLAPADEVIALPVTIAVPQSAEARAA